MRDYCSPRNEKEPFCFPTKVLNILVQIYNMVCFKKPIRTGNANKTGKELYNLLNMRLKEYCGNNRYWLWCSVLEMMANQKQNSVDVVSIKYKLKQIEKKHLQPEKPLVWYKNPKTWLSNYDIQNVMNQYKDHPKYKYDFIGVFPIDFSEKSASGTCLYSSFCNIDIKSYVKHGIKYIGLITNLDKHNESGSHWTSSFIIIDPDSASYGIYYYDSAVNVIPTHLNDFFNNVKQQCDKLYPAKKLTIQYNLKKHQYKNTECGVFSMIFQIRWLNKLILKQNLTNFAEITANPFINDDKMLEIRDHLFRPNSRHELKSMMTNKARMAFNVARTAKTTRTAKPQTTIRRPIRLSNRIVKK